MDFEVELLLNEFVTHDVRRLIVSRPAGFSCVPGQGVELRIDTPQWREEGRPFTPTSLEDDRVVEFTIKGYPEHEGVTQALHALRPGAALRMSEPFGTISYRGPGTFIAGGAGVTPFIAILRQLVAGGQADGHGMLFSNKSAADVICEKELRHAFGEALVLTCTQAQAPGCARRRIDRDFLAEHIRDFGQHFYVCGPPGFMEGVTGALRELGADPDTLVFER